MAPPPPPPLGQSTNYESHVAALAFPFGTHAGPLLAIVRRLAAAAPNILFSFFTTSKSNNSLFPNDNDQKLLPSNMKVFDVGDGVPEGYVFVGRPQEDIDLFMNAAPDNFRRSLEAAAADTGKQVSCLITDAFIWFGAHLADDFGATWFPFWLSGLNALSVHIHTDLIRDTIGTQSIAGRENELIARSVNIPGLSKVRIKDLPEGVIFGNLESVFARALHQTGRMLPRATAVVSNCFDEFHIPITNDLESKFNTLLNVGPFNVTSPPPPAATDHTGCLSWLDKQKAPSSVVYIAFGSMAKLSDEELMAVAEALEATGAPFIWSLKETYKTPKLNEFLTTRLTGNGLVVAWAPQPHILAHTSVGAFVTHGGWNSLVETIFGGVPMICRPFFGDHQLNARMVEDVLEIGVIVEGGVLTKEVLLKNLNLILSHETEGVGNKFRDNLKTVQQLAQQAVGPQGSSTRNFKLLLDAISATKV